MFIPIFIIGLAIWLWLGRLVLRWVKPDSRRGVWRWFLVGTLLMCTADHIAGIIYAHAWVAMAQGERNLHLRSDSVAVQHVVGSKEYWYAQQPMDLQIEKYFGMVNVGYSKLQVIAPSEFETQDLSHNAYELVLTSNSSDPDCKQFYALPINFKEKKPNEISPTYRSLNQEELLKLSVKNIKDGDKARCIAVRSIPGISAKYLAKSARIAPNPPRWVMGPFEYDYSMIIDLASNNVLCENRNIVFWGGWVFRYFLINTEASSQPPSYIVKQLGICQLHAASQQKS